MYCMDCKCRWYVLDQSLTCFKCLTYIPKFWLLVLVINTIKRLLTICLSLLQNIGFQSVHEMDAWLFFDWPCILDVILLKDGERVRRFTHNLVLLLSLVKIGENNLQLDKVNAQNRQKIFFGMLKFSCFLRLSSMVIGIYLECKN